MSVKYSITKAGVDFDQGWSYNRNIILCNWVSISLAMIALLLSVVVIVAGGWTLTGMLGLVAMVILFLPVEFNRRGLTDLSRVWLSVMLVFLTLEISVIDKLANRDVLEEVQYFQFRVILLGISIIPVVLFRIREKKLWIPLLTLNLAGLALYDLVHQIFGVGYYEVGFSGENYQFMNVLVLFAFGVLAALTYFLKSSFERYEEKNELLIRNLFSANDKLERKNLEIANHQKEIEAAALRLKEQREQLMLENEELNSELFEKNAQLTETNAELIRHNNELLQFSYTVSHNLRGPVASLVGLLNLLPKTKSPEEQEMIINHITPSIQSLDSIIRDLGSIIDHRNQVSQLKQVVVFQDEVDKVIDLLGKMMLDYNVKIVTDFSEVSGMLSIKAMISSIFYNLISNAIKYRSPDRDPVIRITSFRKGEFIGLRVQDNGIGLDTSRFRDKLFGLYKRFHTHTEGKGIGLFLVKLQAEALGGRVEVDGVPGSGTEFRIFLRHQQVAGDQVLLENDMTRIHFDAGLNAMYFRWRRTVDAGEYREVISVVSEFMKKYRVPTWIADISDYPNDDDSINRIRKEFAQNLKSFGLRSVVMIIKEDGDPNEIDTRKEVLKNAFDMDVAFFSSDTKAKEWVEQRNLEVDANAVSI